MGIHETERNLNNKISRGGVSAVFLIQCLAAAGCHTVRIVYDFELNRPGESCVNSWRC